MEIVLWIVGLFLAFIVLPALAITILLFRRKTITDFDKLPDDRRWDNYAPYREEILSGIAYLRSLSPERVRITADDGIELAGEWFDRGSDRTALLLHGFCSTPYNNFAVIGEEFLKRGFNVLAVYQRGHNESGGRCTTLGLTERYDLLRWIDWAEKHFPSPAGSGKIVLYGISMGGTSIGYAADMITSPAVRCMVLDCCYSSPYGQMYEDKGAAAVLWLPVMPFIRLFSRLFYGVDIRESISNPLGRTKIPAFFIGGLADRKVPPKQFLRSYEACAGEKQLEQVPGAAHALAFTAADGAAREKLFGFIENTLYDHEEEEI
ncbi:MAG: alpha/beta fold hydrolase [Clostridia bacterium]|nr:alpha/beta fold hydrolase [Clostridia bacterium]